MIVVKSPLRISFVGGGTDLPDFYHRFTGRVLSVTINKYIYVLINPTPLIDKFTIKYQKTEIVDNSGEIENTRVKETLIDLGITEKGIEIGSFADLPAKTGLGSSSSFAVALIKGLNLYLGNRLNKMELAEMASRLEIDLLKEPIGKQDQYASSFGGFNVFQFNKDNSVEVNSLPVGYKEKALLEDNLLLFFTGITRAASSVLADQKLKIDKNIDTYKKMANSVYDFEKLLLNGNIKGMAEMLHEGWERKKSLSSNVSNSVIDKLYEVGIKNGAMGGKILGAGGGGCIMFLASPEKHLKIRQKMQESLMENNLVDGKEIPVRFSQSGADILLSDSNILNGF